MYRQEYSWSGDVPRAGGGWHLLEEPRTSCWDVTSDPGNRVRQIDQDVTGAETVSESHTSFRREACTHAHSHMLSHTIKA